jgi:S1-C subfamily serine protease
VGDFAMVIASPLGFEGSVTVGVISGLHRDIPDSATRGEQPLVDLIQTDASISPGSSGGALLDDQGRVLGLSEAYIAPQAGAVRLGFAIPARTVVRVAEELLEDGRAVHAYLGIRFGRLTPEMAESLGADRPGALVLSVQPGGPAADAGVVGGDVIVAVDGEATDSTEHVLGQLRQTSVGDELELTLVRDGQEQEVTVTVRERPQPPVSSAPSGSPGG